MPDYTCAACGHYWQAQGFALADNVVCPACQSVLEIEHNCDVPAPDGEVYCEEYVVRVIENKKD